MSARRARQVRAAKEAERQYRRRTTLYVQLDADMKRIWGNAFRQMFVEQEQKFNDPMFRFFHHVPWVELPPGGLRPQRLDGKPSKF